MRAKIREINFTWHPLAGVWGCQVDFTLTTARQFTDEWCRAEAAGRWRWLAWWRARRAVSRHAREHAARPGEREKKGWPP